MVGLREQDTLLALGIEPVAATKVFDGTGAIRSWAKPKLGGAKPPVELDRPTGSRSSGSPPSGPTSSSGCTPR